VRLTFSTDSVAVPERDEFIEFPVECLIAAAEPELDPLDNHDLVTIKAFGRRNLSGAPDNHAELECDGGRHEIQPDFHLGYVMEPEADGKPANADRNDPAVQLKPIIERTSQRSLLSVQEFPPSAVCNCFSVLPACRFSMHHLLDPCSPWLLAGSAS